MAHLSSQQALKLAADFALTADQMRSAEDSSFEHLARVYEKASRVAFLRAHVLSKDEEVRPRFGEGFSRAVFAIA
jgi:hypothetical protein